jgi:DNA-directed RNA polymerase specialized sigma subunit
LRSIRQGGDNVTAEEYLEQIRKIDTIIINKLNDYHRWVEIAEGMGGVSVGDRVQTSKNLHQIPDAIGRYIDIEREIEELKRKRQAIIGTIERLPSIEYRLLYQIYVNEKMLKELPSMFGMSYDWVKKTKARALRNVQAILDE